MSAQRPRHVVAALPMLLAAACGAGSARPAARADHRRPRVVVVAPESVAPGLGSALARDGTRVVIAATASRLREGVSAALAEARRRALAFEYAEALEAINRAQVLLESGAAIPEDWDALHSALAYRALVEATLGRRDAARAVLRRAACMRPGGQLDAVRFPPDLIAEYREVAEEVRSAPPSALTVTAEPPGAQVELDGVSIGQAPVTAHGCPGPHYVRVSALGFSGRVLSVDLSTPTAGPLNVALPRAPEAELAGQLLALGERELFGRRRSMLARLDAEALIRVAPPARGIAPLVGISAQGAAPLHRDAPVSDLRRSIRGLGDELASPPERPTTSSSSVFSSPWFWLSAGALVVTTGVVTFVAVDREPDPVLRVTTD